MALLSSFLLCACCLLARAQTPLLSANFSGPGVPSQPMIINNEQQPNFTLVSPFFDCSLSHIFTYWQNDTDLLANTPTLLSIATAVPAAVALTTKYGLLRPTLSNGSCEAPGCTLAVTNNCAPPIHYLNYFDILEVSISAGGT